MVNGHQLALLGAAVALSIEVRGIVRLPPSLPTGSGSGSLDRAVAVMLKQHRPLFRLSALTMVAVVAAAISIAWLKMETIWALGATAVFVGCFVAIAATLSRLDHVMNLGHMIHGDAHVDGIPPRRNPERSVLL